MNGSPMSALLSSRKFWVVALVLVGVGILAGLGRVTPAEALGFAKWVVTAWLGSVAVEDGAAKLSTKLPSTNVAVASSSQDAPASSPVLPASSSSSSTPPSSPPSPEAP